MSERSATLLAEALKLSDDERAEMAEELLESLDEVELGIDSLSEAELIAELDRRAAELREHPERGVPWEQVREMR